MVVQDRDRLAADLQSGVVQRIFAAGMSLQSVLAMATQTEVRRRVEASISDLDDAIRLLRQAIFGLESRMAPQGLRHQVLQLCADVSPVPEITFAGPVDEALPPEEAEGLLEMLRTALGLLGDARRADLHQRRGRGAAQRHGGRNRPAPAGRQRRRGAPATSLRCASEPAGMGDRDRDRGPANGTRVGWSVPPRPLP